MKKMLAPKHKTKIISVVKGVIGISIIVVFSTCNSGKLEEKPNIVLILADDLGYGDISCYNNQSKINTPNIDALAREGVMFTDAHTNSSVCTPTRYGLLTGRYSWRTRLKESVLYGYDKALIRPERMTMASLLKKQGYQTAAIGKWHLGWDWNNIDAGKDQIDFSKPISNGPNSVGFDYWYGIIGSLSMPPYVWVENDMPTMVPTKRTSSDKKQSIWLEGEIADDFVHQQVLPDIRDRAIQYIDDHAADDGPFFLYLPLTAPHNPILPSPEYLGESGLDNPYPDFVMMVDGLVADVKEALKTRGVLENTVFIFVSDNGCSNQADFEQLASKGHFPSHIFRGYKADLYEGGHRVPFIVSWPKKVKPGKSDQLICTTDFLATFVDILGVKLPDDAGEDSYSFAASLGLASDLPMRESVVLHSFDGSFAYRKGDWKILMTPSSGGWSHPRPNSEGIELLPAIQLYDLENDISESTNVQEENPDIVQDLQRELSDIIRKGRSTPGEIQKNDEVESWKQLNWMHN